jgi:hypothetical protein
MEEKICPLCNSKRIISQRHDTDWGGGNNTNWVNQDECYQPGDQDAGGDIYIYVCIECDFTWPVWGSADDKLRAVLAAKDAELAASRAEIEGSQTDNVRLRDALKMAVVQRNDARAEIERLKADNLSIAQAGFRFHDGWQMYLAVNGHGPSLLMNDREKALLAAINKPITEAAE